MFALDNRTVLNGLFANGLIALKKSVVFDGPFTPMPANFDFNRVEGMLLGLAIGDALGNTNEGMLPGHRRHSYGEIKDYIEPARPSDDSQLAFWTLQQLLEDGYLNPEHLGDRFCKGRIYGIGSTTKRFIGNRKDKHLPWYSCGPTADSASNGALMRIAPILIPHLRSQTPFPLTDAAIASMLTHNDSASTASCVAFVYMLWQLLSMEKPPNANWWLDTYVSVASQLESNSTYTPRGGDFMSYRGTLWEYVRDCVSTASQQQKTVLQGCDSWYSGAYLLETMPSVIYILTRHADDPEKAIIRAVNDTKDNDTIAAIVGAAVGALHGKSALPKRWLKALPGRTTESDNGKMYELLAEARTAFWDTGHRRRERGRSHMDEVRVFYDKAGNTLTVWFGNPEDEHVCEETGDEVILMKDKKGNVIGFEKLNFSLPASKDLRLVFESAS